MPTRMSAGAYSAGGGGGGGGGGGSAGGREERMRLALVAGRLRRTHNMIEHMIENERRERRAEALLERRAREAMRDRGELGGDGDDDGDGMADASGDDPGGPMTDRQRRGARDRDAPPSWRSPPSPTTATKGEDDVAEVVVRDDDEWSLADAVMLYGTADQARRISPNPANADGGGWTEAELEAERADLLLRMRRQRRGGAGGGKKSPSSSLLRLYDAYDILERAACALGLGGGGTPSSSSSSNGGSNGAAAFRSAVSWLLAYASRSGGLGVRGISSGGGASAVGGDGTGTMSLSLFGLGHSRHHRTTGSLLAAGTPSSSSSSLATTDLHRLRQYASLGSALLYLSAKRAGVGRTLAEVCSAFGTCAATGTGGGGEPLVRPKHCSRAMQELRAALPGETVSPTPPTPPTPAAVPSSASSADGGGGETAAPRRAVGVTPTPVKGERCTATTTMTATVANNVEEDALADLTTRIADALGLPPCAAHAAAAVAVQCARDARASSQSAAPLVPTKQQQRRVVGKAHIRPVRRGRGGGDGGGAAPDDVVAIASILLVCTAGGTMQRLARQATSNAASSSDVAGGIPNSMSNPLDDLTDDTFVSESDRSGRTTTNHIKGEETSSTDHAKKQQPETSPPWKAWNDQPPWHRDICQMERCTVIPRRAIISYYSSVVHPRRLYFLGVAGRSAAVDGTSTTSTTTTELLLRSISAAVPLMSLRNL